MAVATTDATIENDPAPGVFHGDPHWGDDGALTVNYTVSGTATAGADYVALPGSITIPVNGASSATINVATIDDPLVESLETVKLTLTANAAYVINPPASTATVNIVDDDTNVVNVIATDSVATEVDLSVPGAVADTGTFHHAHRRYEPRAHGLLARSPAPRAAASPR